MTDPVDLGGAGRRSSDRRFADRQRSGGAGAQAEQLAARGRPVCLADSGAQTACLLATEPAPIRLMWSWPKP